MVRLHLFDHTISDDPEQCCGSGMNFFGAGSDFEGSFGSESGCCMDFFIIIESESASGELHGKLALYC
jgi:hypothetical protein